MSAIRWVWPWAESDEVGVVKGEIIEGVRDARMDPVGVCCGGCGQGVWPRVGLLKMHRWTLSLREEVGGGGLLWWV